MPKAKVAVFVARDAAPSQALELLAAYLHARGWVVRKFLGHGKASPFEGRQSEWEDAFINASVLISGMSAPAGNATEEVAAIERAIAAHVPYGLYADTFGAWKRRWFDDFRHLPTRSPRVVFVLNPLEAGRASGHWRKAQCLPTGNPCWEEFFASKAERLDVRARYCADERPLILVPGGKEEALNVALLRAAIDAALSLPKVAVVFTQHPNDKAGAGVYLDLLSQVALGDIQLHVPSEATPLIIPGADLVICTASTTGIEAGHLWGQEYPIPVINFFTEAARDRMERVFGSREWPLVPGVEDGTDRLENLAALMRYRLTPEGRAEMQAQQERAYPRPSEPQAALKRMYEALGHLVAGR